MDLPNRKKEPSADQSDTREEKAPTVGPTAEATSPTGPSGSLFPTGIASNSRSGVLSNRELEAVNRG
jgi:hypothetical protein